jgi:hypothetical protein
MSRLGVNLRKNVTTLSPEECLKAQNLIWTDGMKKRGGQDLITSTEVVASKPVKGLHRYYKSDGTSQLLAAAGTTVKYLDGSSWTNVQTGLTDEQEVHMSTWGGVDKVYISNGADELYSWDGSSATTLSGGNIPSSIIQTIPYQDRLLAIDNTNPGTLTWSDSFSDTAGNWVAASSTGVKPDTQLFGMINHSVNNTSSGIETKILLAGANGMHLFSGTDLRTPATTGDYTIYSLGVDVGCQSPRTMAWTPAGTMWLGIDKQVYILPFNSATPIAVGSKIQSEQGDITGIDNIPSGQLGNASAVYHDGFYKLSITKSGGSYNTEQWWLDITRFQGDQDGVFGPWYGPMIGQSIGPQITLTGTGDIGQHYAGEGQDKGFVYEISKDTQRSDVEVSDGSAKEITCSWKTYYNPLNNPAFRKQIGLIEAEFLDTDDSVSASFNDIDGLLRSATNFQLQTSAVLWGAQNWGAFTWNDFGRTRKKLPISPVISPRRMCITLTNSSSDNDFKIFTLLAKAVEGNQEFE